MEKRLLAEAKELTVLYVEDEAMTQKIMTNHLQSFFSQVLTAQNGEEGLALYQKHPQVDIVISDISMPVMDGLEMVRAMKEQKKEQRIILISAHGDAHNLLRAIELEVNHYLIKPVYRKKLVEVLYHMVRIINQDKKIREAEEALKESEKRYRTLVDNLPLGVYRKEAGPEGSFVMVNPALVRMLGYHDEEELLGGSFKRIFWEEEEDFFQEEEFLQKEVCLSKKDGQPLWVLISSRPVKDALPGVSYYDGTIEDISLRKEAESRLAAYMMEIEMKNMALEEANNKINADLEKARLIHQQLLPISFPTVEGLTLAAHYQPAENIGGDFYNMHLLGDNLLIYLTDVTGHGLDGAILSVFVRETVNSYLDLHSPAEISPSSLLEFISSRYCMEKFPHDYFICMLIGIYQVKKGLLSFVNAGMQVGPYLTTQDQLHCIQCSGPPISSVFGTHLLDLNPHSVSLEEGAALLLTTDGLIEEKQGETMYGEERLKDVFYASRGSPPLEIISSITDSFNRFCGDRQGRDDITLLVMKRDAGGRGG